MRPFQPCFLMLPTLSSCAHSLPLRLLSQTWHKKSSQGCTFAAAAFMALAWESSKLRPHACIALRIATGGRHIARQHGSLLCFCRVMCHGGGGVLSVLRSAQPCIFIANAKVALAAARRLTEKATLGTNCGCKLLRLLLLARKRNYVKDT